MSGWPLVSTSILCNGPCFCSHYSCVRFSVASRDDKSLLFFLVLLVSRPTDAVSCGAIQPAELSDLYGLSSRLVQPRRCRNLPTLQLRLLDGIKQCGGVGLPSRAVQPRWCAVCRLQWWDVVFRNSSRHDIVTVQR